MTSRMPVAASKRGASTSYAAAKPPDVSTWTSPGARAPSAVCCARDGAAPAAIAAASASGNAAIRRIGLLLCPMPTDSISTPMDPGRTYDVLVAGGGNAALCAALTARSAGASVLLLESAGSLPGTSAAATAGTRATCAACTTARRIR